MIPTHFRHRGWIGLVLLLLCGCGQRANDAGSNDMGSQVSRIDPASQVTAEEVVSKTFSAGTKPRVVVEVFLGPIEVVAGKDEAIHATLTKRAGGKTKEEAQAALKDLTLNYDQQKDGVRIVAVVPKGKRVSGGVGARLEVPVDASLELKTSLDRIAVSGIHGSVRAHNSQGPIAIKDARGPQHLSTSLARIEADGPSDQITATNSQGEIVISGATGKVALTTSLAQIDVDAPATEATIKNSQGGIRIRRARGTLDLATSLAGIDVDAPCTRVAAENSQGAITVAGAKGPLKLSTSLADILVRAEGAEVEAVNSQGGITINGGTGRIAARTSLAAIRVEARDAVVAAENSQGPVAFRGSLAPGKHSFRTSLANVSLVLPADASFHLDATASLGTITNAFPLAQTQQSSPTRLVGTVGLQPQASVQVQVSQGSVTIAKRQ